MAYTCKLDLAGNFRSSQPSSSTLEKYESTIRSLTNSNLEGSHWERERESIRWKKKNKPTAIYIHENHWVRNLKYQTYRKRMHTFGFLSLSNSIALQPYTKRGGLKSSSKKLGEEKYVSKMKPQRNPCWVFLAWHDKPFYTHEQGIDQHLGAFLV